MPVEQPSDQAGGPGIDSAVVAATRFRRAIEATRPHPTSFGSFPTGACGAVCELLGDYLRDSGLGDWLYVMGLRATDNGGTHAWLERDGILIDITGDQFPGVVEKVLVRVAPAFAGEHLGFEKSGAGRPAGLAYWAGASHDEDAAYYAKVRAVADRL